MYRVMECRTLLLVIVTILGYSNSIAGLECRPGIKDPQPRIGLLISPAISSKSFNDIVIYWDNLDYHPKDLIVLYKETIGGGRKPIHSVAVQSRNGSDATGVQAEFIPSSNLTFVPQCLQYYVRWINNGISRLENCIKTEPTWMHDRKDYLGSLIMSKVFVPGSHNTAAYRIYEGPSDEKFLEKYAITQDIDILSQLIYGVRYLDIRVGYYPNFKEPWFTNHGIYRSVSFQKVVDQVKTFLDNTQEIVILDIQEFATGFGKNMTIHHQFVAHLKEQFADYLLPKNFGWSTTLNIMWSTGKRLIIGYDDGRIVAQYEHVWPCVRQQWGDVRNIRNLFDYLNRVETSYRGARLIPRSTMAELTPNTLDVILNRLGGLRKMAASVNLNVTSWYTNLWQDTANIVAVDFLRSTGIVQTAIEVNDRRRMYC